VDTVIVVKVDRVTRKWKDFVELLELVATRGVSLVIEAESLDKRWQ
jgi:DNA invertase Pin-like site-specific DNA recombinase